MKYIAFLIFVFLVTGCTNHNMQKIEPQKIDKDIIHTELPTLVREIASELVSKKLQDTNSSVAVTSFVDLSKLNKTTKFGQILAESLIADFDAHNIKVIDFRGQQAVNINANGEFLLSRDTEKLRKEFQNSLVVVGTFSNFDGNIIINARILDFECGNVISSSRSYLKIKDSRLFDTCENIESSIINISKDQR